MLSLTLSRNSDQPLADQIVAGIKRQIEDRHLRPGTKLPSIRSFAESCNVSRFTVVEAYDRLVAMGCLQSRRGAGFYTAPAIAEPAHPSPSDSHKRNEEITGWKCWRCRAMPTGRTSPFSKAWPLRTGRGLFHPVGDAQPDRRRYER